MIERPSEMDAKTLTSDRTTQSSDSRPKQIVRCRLFPPEGHTPEATEGHGLTPADSWTQKLYSAVDAWAIDLHTVGPQTTQERLRHFRMAQQIAEDLVVVAESEGEKRVLAEKWDHSESRALEAARSSKFVIDGQLDLMVSLAHGVTNLVARTLATHPRWRTASALDIPKGATKEARRVLHGVAMFKPKKDGSIPDGGWINANRYAPRVIRKMAETIGDPALEALVREFEMLARSSEWQQVLRLRGKRHHRDHRWLPQGLQAVPDATITGAAYGGPDGATFMNSSGSINTDHQTKQRLKEAAKTSTDAVPAIVNALLDLHPCWLEVVRHIDDPKLLEPWTKPRPDDPPPSANGENMRFKFYLRLSEESADRFRPTLTTSIWESHGIDCFPLMDKRHPRTITAGAHERSSDVALESIKRALVDQNISIEDYQSALPW